jgi:hypothetical protein
MMDRISDTVAPAQPILTGALVALAASIAGIALFEVLTGVSLTSGFYVWTTPAWLAWYLYTVYATTAQPSKTCDPMPLAEGREATP